MALGGARAGGASVLDQLLEEINFQRTKEMRQLMKDDSGFVVLQGTTYWTDLFVRHFLFQEERSIDCDDLLFFVRKRHVKGSSRYLPKYETDVEVFRKDSKKLPIGDPEVDWEETVYLNLVVHQFDYTLTLAVCTRTSPKELQVLRRHSLQVYASPSRRKMDTKGDGEEMTYPHICFMVDNFDEVFCDILVRDGEMVCVELVARGRGGGAGGAGGGGGGAQAVIFLGSIRYDALTRVYDSRQSSLSTKVAQRMSFGLLGSKAAARCEFVRMKGPCGKGHAEMAVSKPHGAGVDTPSSEPGLCATDMWDSDWEDDPEEMFIYRHQRRLSDPSANLNNFARGGLRAREATSRSEDAGLDSLVSGIAEVEAGDLRDVERRSQASSAACLRRRAPPAAPATPPAAPAAPPAPRVAPAAPPTALPPPRPLDNTPTKKHRLKTTKPKQDDGECEVADDAGSLDEKDFSRTQNKTIHSNSESTIVRGKEELPCYRELHVYNAMRKTFEDTNGNEADDEGGEERGPGAGAGAGLPRRARLPPRRTTPDGTDIYYWCDVPKRKWSELDDGAYNPLWAMRGFTQTFHLWKEGRRAQCTPLHASLTYVTLPWWSIAKDILDIREEPILTF